LEELIRNCVEHCKSLGFKVVWAMVENKHLINMCLDGGWKKWGGPQTVLTYKNN
jgi:EAL domain-containing protein (putative c-di-GMP-specific phosphodiesterase class I)